MSDIHFETLVNVVDERALRAFALHLNPDLGDGMSVEDALAEVLVNPRNAPLDAGYEITRKTVFQDHGDRFRARIEARVVDAERLVEAAGESHRLAYGGDELEADNLGTAFYEHVLGSNASPPNLDVGFEVIDSWHHGPAISTSPTP